MDLSEKRLAALAGALKAGPLPPPSDFIRSRAAPHWPPLGAAWAVPFFFTAVKHLFGLWREEDGRFAGPVAGIIDGRRAEGDDYMWMALARTAQEEPDFLLPAAQAELTMAALKRAFRDDRNDCPVPLLEGHLELARAYGRALQDLKLTPNKILEQAHAASGPPLHAFTKILAELPGYREDRLQRKAFLLGLILSRRPEKFLKAGDGPWPPVLDRHMLRLALRWGALEVTDPDMAERLAQGRAVPPVVEERVRLASYDAFARLFNDAGRAVPDTLEFFQDARAWCPEDRAPDCAACVFGAACAKRITLKNPVVRTTAY